MTAIWNSTPLIKNASLIKQHSTNAHLHFIFHSEWQKSMFPTGRRPYCGITWTLRYVNLFQTLTRQPVFIQALSALISVCGGVYVFIMERKEVKGREYEKARGRVEITVWGSVLSMCAMRNRKRKVGMYNMFISILVIVKNECVYNHFLCQIISSAQQFDWKVELKNHMNFKMSQLLSLLWQHPALF